MCFLLRTSTVKRSQRTFGSRWIEQYSPLAEIQPIIAECNTYGRWLSTTQVRLKHLSLIVGRFPKTRSSSLLEFLCDCRTHMWFVSTGHAETHKTHTRQRGRGTHWSAPPGPKCRLLKIKAGKVKGRRPGEALLRLAAVCVGGSDWGSEAWLQPLCAGRWCPKASRGHLQEALLCGNDASQRSQRNQWAAGGSLPQIPFWLF